MNIFRRLFKIGQAESNSAIDKMEDPIKMTEQGIRDMKEDLHKSLEALAQVKALAIRTKNDFENYESKAEDYQNKALLLLQKAQKGNLEMPEAERLAKAALIKKEENSKLATSSKEESDKYQTSLDNLNKNIRTIKSNISKWENELKTLKARVKVSDATKNLNKQLANIDSSGTVSLLERMKEKVAQDEALAAAYGEIANESKSIDDEIDKLVDSTENSAQNSLDKLKEQLGLNDKKES